MGTVIIVGAACFAVGLGIGILIGKKATSAAQKAVASTEAKAQAIGKEVADEAKALKAKI